MWGVVGAGLANSWTIEAVNLWSKPVRTGAGSRRLPSVQYHQPLTIKNQRRF
ncbi:hypothetical protein QH73_0009545 [Scytonema millei VB511283]|uniref:Uncharacterized protein n=1 Tax=Scytonema millei VB511283 TaxID=1245923 RepID=A0A9X5E453_9CYAN|nr:hypothetical protein [Scytonema millei VB511283]